jgi:hypothetical protein
MSGNLWCSLALAAAYALAGALYLAWQPARPPAREGVLLGFAGAANPPLLIMLSACHVALLAEWRSRAKPVLHPLDVDLGTAKAALAPAAALAGALLLCRLRSLGFPW